MFYCYEEHNLTIIHFYINVIVKFPLDICLAFLSFILPMPGTLNIPQVVKSEYGSWYSRWNIRPYTLKFSFKHCWTFKRMFAVQ